MMQEIIRTHFDQYLEDLESGKFVQSPLVLSISKGVPIPSTLTLFREHLSLFSLQPSRPMMLTELNAILDHFYSKHAKTITAEQWLGDNAFADAVADDADIQWMAKWCSNFRDEIWTGHRSGALTWLLWTRVWRPCGEMGMRWSFVEEHQFTLATNVFVDAVPVGTSSVYL